MIAAAITQALAPEHRHAGQMETISLLHKNIPMDLSGDKCWVLSHRAKGGTQFSYVDGTPVANGNVDGTRLQTMGEAIIALMEDSSDADGIAIAIAPSSDLRVVMVERGIVPPYRYVPAVASLVEHARSYGEQTPDGYGILLIGRGTLDAAYVPDRYGKGVHLRVLAEHACMPLSGATLDSGRVVRSFEQTFTQMIAADSAGESVTHFAEDKQTLPLSVIFANELHEEFIPANEVVEGVLAAGASSMLYGDSNSGKTFFAIDMGASIARGEAWMGRQTEEGLVVYLAAESPASVRTRLHTYQRHHRIKLPNFAVVESPINLFDGEGDTDAVIQVVHALEERTGRKVVLIIGDTLARLSPGANENGGQDMGLVVRNIDRIRAECDAHFMLIHHCGKNAANGARGWSGVRAAIDTEIEVTNLPTGRCAEITKQRDLGAGGDRIGFRLEPLEIGMTKWGKPATSCVVVSADAPGKPQGKRLSEVGGAVLEYLRTQPAGVKKSLLVKHFHNLYHRSAVYRELKKLVAVGQVLECIGIVTANAEVRNGAN